MSKYDYDPGEPHEPPPRRRRSRSTNDTDDAWAAAHEDALAGDGSLEHLAGGYVDREDPRYGVGRRSRQDDADRIGAGRQRGDWRIPYADSPTYRRDHGLDDRQIRERHGPRAQPGYGSRAGVPAGRAPLPMWAIVMIVVLSIAALFAVVLACASILLL
jgi:hypothetical protein